MRGRVSDVGYSLISIAMVSVSLGMSIAALSINWATRRRLLEAKEQLEQVVEIDAGRVSDVQERLTKYTKYEVAIEDYWGLSKEDQKEIRAWLEHHGVDTSRSRHITLYHSVYGSWEKWTVDVTHRLPDRFDTAEIPKALLKETRRQLAR